MEENDLVKSEDTFIFYICLSFKISSKLFELTQFKACKSYEHRKITSTKVLYTSADIICRSSLTLLFFKQSAFFDSSLLKNL